MYCKIVRKLRGIVRTFSYKAKPSVYAGFGVYTILYLLYCYNVREFRKLCPRVTLPVRSTCEILRANSISQNHCENFLTTLHCMAYKRKLLIVKGILYCKILTKQPKVSYIITKSLTLYDIVRLVRPYTGLRYSSDLVCHAIIITALTIRHWCVSALNPTTNPTLFQFRHVDT